MGLLLTFEGLDFCGKSTQIRLLEEHITSLGKAVRTVREPGGTPVGESIRKLLLDPATRDLSDAGELLLFSASRSQLVEQVIRPLLRSSTVVLCDRFYDSTTAYQGGGRGLDTKAVEVINHVATGGLVPDATFLLDVPLEILRTRMEAAGTTRDRMESNQDGFYARVREAYTELARKEKRIHLLDGQRPVHEIAGEIRRIYDSLEG